MRFSYRLSTCALASSLLLWDALDLYSKLPFFSFASQIPLVLPHTTQSLASDRIAIIGAGAGGTSAAFWIAKAKERYGLSAQVDVFDRNDYIGGRSTVVFPYDDDTLEPIELGGSVFVEANKNLYRAVNDFGLERIKFENDEDVVGIWNGQEFLLTMGGDKFYSGWLTNLKILWRYGLKAPRKTQAIVDRMINDILQMYDPAPPVFDNISSLATKLGWTDVAAHTALEYLHKNGIDDRWSLEFVDSITRINYGQDIDRIHALEALVSLASNGASSVKGGNYQIYERFLNDSKATVLLNSEVTSIFRSSPSEPWLLQTSGSTTPRPYRAIILAAPLHQTGIQIHSSPSPASVPKQPYVHLHVTLLTTTSPSFNATYFNLPPHASVPAMVLTSNNGARQGGPAPHFNSLSYIRAVRTRSLGEWRNARGEREWVVKVFSKERISDTWLAEMFDGRVGWALRKEWDAYPVLPPATDFPPVKLAEGLYYVNAFEPLISTMETETVAARNVVDLLLREHFGAGLCKPQVNDAGETIREEKGDGFVYGWDC